MDISQRKEQFSAAFLQAVASIAGYTPAQPQVDDDSIDWMIAARGAVLTRRPRLEVQMKCSSRNLLSDEKLPFPLSIKNYNDLRDANVLVPRILIVMTVPTDIKDWAIHSESEMVIRHCGYWASLRGMSATNNTDNVTIDLPRKQMFTPDALHDIMSRIDAGGTP